MTQFSFFINRLQGRAFDTIDAIKKELFEQDKRATGELINSTRFRITSTDSLITLNFLSAKQWEVVDKGRRPGTFPPVNKIKQWIKRKPVSPEGITIDQLSFLIGRKIKREGIPATNIFTNQIEKFLKNTDIQNLISKDITSLTIKSLDNG